MVHLVLSPGTGQRRLSEDAVRTAHLEQPILLIFSQTCCSSRCSLTTSSILPLYMPTPACKQHERLSGTPTSSSIPSQPCFFHPPVQPPASPWFSSLSYSDTQSFLFLATRLSAYCYYHSSSVCSTIIEPIRRVPSSSSERTISYLLFIFWVSTSTIRSSHSCFSSSPCLSLCLRC